MQRSLVLLVGAFVLTLIAGCGGGHSTESGPTEKVVFLSDRDHGEYWPWYDEIYIMNIDGSNPVRVTDNSESEYAPTLSPDETKIAFTMDSTPGIWIMDADGSMPTQLTDLEDALPRFSADGSRIVFTRSGDGHPDVWVMNIDGSEQTRLTTNPGADNDPCFTPDGGKIVFASNRPDEWPAHSRIYIMDADGSDQTRLTDGAGSDDMWPVVSPDGTKIAFASNRESTYSNIYIMGLDGSSVTRVTYYSDSGGASRPRFSRDSSRILFEGGREGVFGIHSTNLDGSAGYVQLTGNGDHF